ncbi:hypothetical protein [Desulfitobacterium sp.]|uniref:hypothetical protein n=1 Tax=Desulfitobacterium sp. TaxID=49981 RepID=UPI002B2078ED|nr:hypothetical protein [Desulfitobacterium sp.]MEA4901311.1 hypothetical protein [Desulfitobacterium sp.]
MSNKPSPISVIVIFAIMTVLVISIVQARTKPIPGPLYPAEDKAAEEDLTEIKALADTWANAYSERDGDTLYRLCKNNDLFTAIGGYSFEDGRHGFGMSSPWPWDKDHKIVLGNGIIDIYYYFRASDPHIWVHKETLTYEKLDSVYQVADETMIMLEPSAKKVFIDAYQYGLPDFAGFSTAYQLHADSDPTQAEIYCDPANAAQNQLNISHATAQVEYLNEPGTARVTFVWPDGSVKVLMRQPKVHGDSGIWVVEQVLDQFPSSEKEP